MEPKRYAFCEILIFKPFIKLDRFYNYHIEVTLWESSQRFGTKNI